jgi:hypothetical protein
MTPTPIVKVLDASGNTLHDCLALGCSTSWDGYVLADGYTSSVADPADPARTLELAVAKGDRVQGARDPGPQWDTSRAGVARLLETA